MDVRPECFQFSTAVDWSPSVATADWRFVCRGRGAFDFAAFLGLCLDPAARRSHEYGLIERYLQAGAILENSSGNKQLMSIWSGGGGGEDKKAELHKDLRAGFLVNFAFFIVRHCASLEGLAASSNNPCAAAARGV